MVRSTPIEGKKAREPVDSKRKLFLVVTGMHRSGTSFLARAFNLCGVNLGNPEDLHSDQWRPELDNIRGHWENKEILKLTEETLSQNGGSWDNIPENIVISEELSKKIEIFIRTLMNYPSFAVGFKDPRIITCLEAWQKLLPENFILVGIFRHPLKVAESLRMRNNFGYEKSLDLWCKYNERLLSLVEKYNGFLLDFDWPKDKLFSEFNVICKKIGIPSIDLSQWYDKELLHSNISFNSEHKLGSKLNSIYSNLQKKSSENKFVNVKPITFGKTDLEDVIKNLLLLNERQGEYFRKLNDRNLKTIENLTSRLPEDPLGILLSLYSKRHDLQEHYPEVLKGDYVKLVEWAYNVCNKTILHDDSYDILAKHADSYLHIISTKNFLEDNNLASDKIKLSANKISKNPNPLYVLTSLYSLREDLRTRFPEVREGKYEGLIEWATGVSNELIPDSDANLLKPYSLWYKNETDKRSDLARLKENIELLKKQSEEISQFHTRKIEELQGLRNDDARKIKELKVKNQDIEEQILSLNVELINIKSSAIYRLTKKIAGSLDSVLPPNTSRGRFLKKITEDLRDKDVIGSSHVIRNHLNQKSQIPEYLKESENATFYEQIYKDLDHKPRISIVMPTFNTDIDVLGKTIDSVKGQYYPDWELCICDDGSSKLETKELIKTRMAEDSRIKVIFSESNEGISKASNKALKLTSGEYIVLLDHDDELSKNALMEIVKLINVKRDADFIYSDEDKIDANDVHGEPFFKPDWSPDLFLSFNYPIHVSVFRSSILKEIGGFRSEFDGSQDYDLILRFTEKARKIEHIPKVLYSWRKIPGSTSLSKLEKNYPHEAGKKALVDALKRRKIDAVVEDGVDAGRYRVRYKIKGKPLVSIIIPTRNLHNLKTIVESVLKKSTYRNFEIIVLDNSKTCEIRAFCEEHGEIKRLDISNWKFNFSKFNNYGVLNSKGEHILFLNDDTEVITPDWIECLLEHAQRDEVGIVGSKLLYKDNFVQHAGTIIGMGGYAGNYGGMKNDNPGYFWYPQVIRNCSAVTAACMIMKRIAFDNVGGFDEEMAQSWQDVDLCLKVIKYGKSVIFTPYSLLYHYEGTTRGKVDTTEEEEKAKKLFRQKNFSYIKAGDPFYNPNLSTINAFYYEMRFDDPMKLLKYMYSRRDLQNAFPDDDKNGYKKLIDWAVTYGITIDSFGSMISPQYDYLYHRCSEEVKPIAKRLELFRHSKQLKNNFPEVFDGKFEAYLKFAESNIK